jgi:hypothetical protein
MIAKTPIAKQACKLIRTWSERIYVNYLIGIGMNDKGGRGYEKAILIIKTEWLIRSS